MILTEEQRAALKRVVAYMDEMYAIASPYHGCTEDANILRAMIDSSEHIREPPKMIGFDLEKNRAAIDSAINSLLCEGWDNEASTVRRLVAEIERLRAKVGKMEFLMRSTDDTCLACAIKLEVVDQQAVRIQELEDALVERSAIVMFLQEAWGSTIQFRAAKAQMGEWKRLPEDFKESWRKGARKQLQAEGKIGPDADAKPHCWQITEERKAAIKELSELLTAIGCPSCHYYIQKNYGEDITVLRVMLTEAGQE